MKGIKDKMKEGLSMRQHLFWLYRFGLDCDFSKFGANCVKGKNLASQVVML